MLGGDDVGELEAIGKEEMVGEIMNHLEEYL